MRVVLGGIEIHLLSGVSSETRSPLAGGSALVRMASGAGQRMTCWQRYGVTLTGDGLRPAGIDGLDAGAAHELWSMQPMSIITPATVVDLPRPCRPDHAPMVAAQLADGTLRRTASSLTGQRLTIVPLDNAVSYRVEWLPVLIVYITDRSDSITLSAPGAMGWSVTLEEA